MLWGPHFDMWKFLGWWDGTLKTSLRCFCYSCFIQKLYKYKQGQVELSYTRQSTCYFMSGFLGISLHIQGTFSQFSFLSLLLSLSSHRLDYLFCSLLLFFVVIHICVLVWLNWLYVCRPLSQSLDASIPKYPWFEDTILGYSAWTDLTKRVLKQYFVTPIRP